MNAIRGLLHLVMVAGLSSVAGADIYRWDNGQVIPGTEGITPGPGLDLDQMSLQYARLENRNLTDSTFVAADLSVAKLDGSN